MLLIEFHKNQYNVENLNKYEDFLIECSKKNYIGLGVHRHHILPRFMNGSNQKENIIILGYEDHYNAHIILAESYPTGSKERWYNTTSANKLFGSIKRSLRKIYGKDFDLTTIDFWREASIKLKELYSGENNCNYGKPVSVERKRKWRISIGDKMKGEGNPRFGVNVTQETRDKISKAMKGKLSGENNPMYGVSVAITDETREKLKKINQENIDKRFPLPNGTFKEDILDKNGKLKKFHRYCQCGFLLSYTTRGGVINSFNKNKVCRQCLGRRYKNEFKGDQKFKKIKYKTIQLETGQILTIPAAKIGKFLQDLDGNIYNSIGEVCKKFDLGYTQVNKLIEIGTFKKLNYSPVIQSKKSRIYRQSKPIQNLETNKIYSTIKDLCKDLNMYYGTVIRRIKSGKFVLLDREEYINAQSK